MTNYRAQVQTLSNSFNPIWWETAELRCKFVFCHSTPILTLSIIPTQLWFWFLLWSWHIENLQASRMRYKRSVSIMLPEPPTILPTLTTKSTSTSTPPRLNFRSKSLDHGPAMASGKNPVSSTRITIDHRHLRGSDKSEQEQIVATSVGNKETGSKDQGLLESLGGDQAPLIGNFVICCPSIVITYWIAVVLVFFWRILVLIYESILYWLLEEHCFDVIVPRSPLLEASILHHCSHS